MNQKLALVIAAVLFANVGCRERPALLPPAIHSDNDYMDLQPGGRLRITVPYTSSGDHVVALRAAKESGSTITLSGSNLIGVQVSHYALEGRADGRIRLKFQEAEIRRDGKAIELKKPPSLPFSLPEKDRHIRLFYLVRSSAADHNMAIGASKDLANLDALTKKLKASSTACETSVSVSCVWVPPGVAVTPE